MRDILLGVLTIGLARLALAADPLYEASRQLERRYYTEAAAKALAVARAADQSLERRASAFELAASAYRALECPQKAIEIYKEELAALGQDNPRAAGAWARIAQLQYNCRDYYAALETLRQATAKLDLKKAPDEVRAPILQQLAACHEKFGDIKGALSAYESLARLSRRADVAASALSKAVRVAVALARYDRALAWLDLIAEKLNDGSAASEAARAFDELAQGLRRAGRLDEARRLERRMVEIFAGPQPDRAGAALERLLRELDDPAALDLVNSLQGQAIRAIASARVFAVVGPAALREGRTDELARNYFRAAIARPLDEANAYACLKAIVRLRVAEGRTDEALAAAKACYGTYGFSPYVSSSQFAKVVSLVADALRAKSGHLVAGNNFRRYQLYGPAGPDRRVGTQDDLKNPFQGVALEADPERDKLFERAIAAQPDTPDGHRTRGWLYLLWCKPKEALKEFKREFALCSLESDALSRAAQDVALGLKALNGTPVGMEAFVQFQRYGPAGPDGRKGTRDDLEDPLAGL